MKDKMMMFIGSIVLGFFSLYFITPSVYESLILVLLFMILYSVRNLNLSRTGVEE